MSEATARPWAIDPMSDDETLAIYSPQSDLHVATLMLRKDDCDTVSAHECFREADAELIVRAVNCFEDLVKACHGVDLLYAEMQSALPSIVGTPGYDIVTEAVRKARAALAKAQE